MLHNTTYETAKRISMGNKTEVPSAHRKSIRRRLAVTMLLGLAVAEFSPMATRTVLADATWTGANSTDWNTAGNWSVAPGGQNLIVNTNTGNIATITANATFTPVDITVGGGATGNGRVDHIAGSVSTGAGNWMFVGANGGTGVYNLANTATTGGTLTGFGQGSGSLAVAGNFYIGGRYFDVGGNGTFNMNTTGTLTAGLLDIFDSNSAGSGTFNLDNGTVTSNGELWVGAWGTGTGTFNQAGGTVNSNAYFVVGRSGTGTYNVTGGTVNGATNAGFIVIGSFGGSNGTMNVSAGTVQTPRQFYVAEGGTGTLNVTGTGLVLVGDLAQGLRLGANGGTGTVNLNGGTIQAAIVTQGSGSGTFNFNGGTLKAGASSSSFFTGLARTNVRDAGAIINTNSFDVTVGQTLEHSDIGGDAALDGGLTKSGAGSLTLTASNNYTGATTVSAGRLVVDGGGAINASSGIIVNGTGARFVTTASTAVTPTVTVTSGGVGGTGTIGTVNVASNAANSVANGNGGTGTLTINTLHFNGAGRLDLTVNGTSPEINTTTLTTTGANSVSVNASSPTWLPGTYNLLSYSSLGGTGFSAFQKGTIAGLSARQSATLSNPSGFISLVIAGDNPKWTGALNSSWTTATLASPKNWALITSGTTTDYINGDVVLFDDSASSFTVNVADATVTPVSTVFNNSAHDYVLGGTGSVAGAGSLTKNGGSALTINNGNTYAGGTLLNAGRLNINNASAIGTGALTVAGGTTIDNTSGSAKTLSTNNAQTWAGDFTFDGSSALNMGTGAVTMTGDRVVTVNGSGALTVGGIGESGGSRVLNKAGAGTLVVGGTSSYTGATNVNEGTLSVAGSITTSSGMNVNGGAVTVGGTVATPQTFVNSGSLTVNSGGSYTTTTGDTFVGVNNTASILVNNGGTLTGNTILVGGYNNTGGTGVATVAAGGTLTAKNWLVVGFANGGNGTLNVNGGTVNVRKGSTFGNIEVSTWDNGTTGVVNMNSGTINLLNNSSIVMGVMGNNAGSSTFNQNGGTVTTYSDDLAAAPGGTGGVIVGQGGTGTHTYNLNGGVLSTGSVTRSGATGVLNLNGGTLKSTRNNANLIAGLTSVNVQAGGAIIDTNGNTVSVTQPLLHDAAGPATDGGLTKNGSGTLRLAGGTSTYAGNTVITGGTIQLASGAAPTAVGQYSFDELTPGALAGGVTVANTGTGTGMNGTVNHANNTNDPTNGGASSVTGKFGKGISFDGWGSSVDVGSKIVDQSGSGTWSMSAWVKTTLPGASIVSKNDANTTWSGGDSVFYLGSNPISGSGGNLPTAVRNAGGFVQGDPGAGTNLTDDAWHMVTYVFNGGVKQVFVDGTPVTMTMTGFDNADPSASVRIGYNINTLSALDGSYNFFGSMDELKFYDVSLNGTQVQSLFNTNTITTGGSQQYLPSTTAVSITAAGASLDLNSNDQIIGSLTGVAGSTVTLGAGTLTTGGNNASTSYAGVVSGTGGLTKTGTGNFTLSGANTYTGTTAVTGGTLTLAPAAQTVVFSGPVTAPGGADVRGGKLALSYTTAGAGATLATNVQSILDAGYDQTPSKFATGKIRSTTLAAGHLLGWRNNTTASQVEVAYTIAGDANLDFVVNFDDLLLLAQNYSTTATGKVWAQGDFTYDTIVNFDDLLGLAQHYNQSAITGELIGGSTGDFAADWAMALSLVPEPTTLTTVSLAMLSLARRNRAGRKS